jgi:hypothetical protein
LLDSNLNININEVFLSLCSTNNQNLDKIIYLINNGADINYKLGTSLCYAMLCHNQMLINFLLTHDIILTDKIFCNAILSNCMNIIDQMISTGFKITLQHIEFAVQYKRHEIIELFINEETDPNDIRECYLNKILEEKSCLTKKCC